MGVFVSLGAVILVAMAFYALRIRELKREAKAAFEEANAKKEAAKRAGKSAKKYNPLAAPKDSPKTIPVVVTPGSKKKKYIGKPQTNSPSPVSPSVSGSSSSSSSTTKIPIIIKKVPQKQTPPGSKGKSTIDDAFQVNSTTRRSLSELLSEMSSMSGKMIPPK